MAERMGRFEPVSGPFIVARAASRRPERRQPKWRAGDPFQSTLSPIPYNDDGFLYVPSKDPAPANMVNACADSRTVCAMATCVWPPFGRL